MIVDFLKQDFEKRKKKNPRYSIRSYARFFGIDSSSLAKILSGSLKLTHRRAKQILDRLEIDPALKNSLLLSLGEHTQKGFPKDADFTVLSAEHASLMAHWEFYAILSLAEIRPFKPDPNWIAKRLGSTVDRVGPILDALILMELIVKKKDGWFPSGKQITAPSDFPTSALKEVHREYIEKSVTALMTHPSETGDISGITIAIPEKKLPEAARRIKEFRRTLAAYLNDESGTDEVYRINIQMFALSKKI